MAFLAHYRIFIIKDSMARKSATINKNKGNAVLIGAGITEKWYFSHMQSLHNLKIKIRPRYFGDESIFAIEKQIKQVLYDGGLAIVAFDTDVPTWNEAERKRLSELKNKYKNNKHVILCDSRPSIEFWFLIHFINTNRYFGTSGAVKAELVKYIKRYDKKEPFLSKEGWVKDMISKGKFHDAYLRAKLFGTTGESYSNLWKAFDYLEDVPR